MNKPRPHLSKDEIRFHGRNSCLAIWKVRPKDVIRVYVHKDKEREYAHLLSDAARQRKSFHIVGDRDLEKLADTTHHQGICLVAKAKPILKEQDFLKEIRSNRQLIIYLEIGNPHNLGAILRSAAHFGISHICIPDSIPRIPPSAHRISEGGAEFVTVIHVKEAPQFLQSMKRKGFQIYGLDLIDSAVPLYGSRFQDKSIFVMGAEVTGISAEVQEVLDASVKIPGSGMIESLNVSVAAALAMGEFFRQGTERNVRIVKSTV